VIGHREFVVSNEEQLATIVRWMLESGKLHYHLHFAFPAGAPAEFPFTIGIENLH